MLKRCAVTILAAMMLSCITGTVARAQSFPNQTVPLAVPTTVTGADPNALDGPVTETQPTQVQSAQTVQDAQPATSASQPVVVGDTGMISQVLTTILQDAWQNVATAANQAQTVGIRIYVFLALISVTLALIPVVFSHEPAHYLKFVLERVVEISLVIGVISNTWSGLGWFPQLVQAGANLGVFIAGSGASIGSPTFNVTSGWSLNVLPGNILNFGGVMFSNIMTATIFTPHGILDSVVSAVNGTFAIQIIIAVLGLLSACWAFFGFAYAAFRMTLVVIKTYLLSPLSVLQGLLGSRRLSSYGGSYFAGGLVLAVEVCLTIIIIGLFYTVVKNEHSFFEQLVQSSGPSSQCSTLFSNPLTIAACLQSLSGTTTQAISVAGLVVIDATVAFFLSSLHNVPKLAADAIQGRFTTSAQEAIQQMKSSPSPFVRAAGSVAGATDSFAREGVVAPTVNAVKGMVGRAVELGAMVAVGMFTGGAGTVAGLATAAGKGAMIGGAEGAIASGLGNFAFGKFGEAMRGNGPSESNTITGTETLGETGSKEDEKSGTARTPTAASASKGSVGASEGTGASDSNETATQHVTMERQVDSDPQAQAAPANGISGTDETVTQHTTVLQELTQQIKELTAAMKGTTAAAGAAGGGSAGAPAAAGAGGGSASRGSAADHPLGAMAEFADSMSLGRMFTQRALYINARQKPPAPPPKEESATMQFNLVR